MSAEPTHFYRAYGLIVAANMPLPDFVAAPESGAADVRIDFVGDAPLDPVPVAQTLRHAAEDDNLYRIDRLADGRLHLRLQIAHDYGEFTIASDGSAVRVAWADTTPLAEIMPFLMNVGIGSMLRARGLLCLHGAALAKDDRAFILIGAQGAGKSTTTAALVARGWLLLADDISVVTRRDDGFYVESGFPRMRLHPETAAYFGAWIGDLPRLWQALPIEKRYLPAEALAERFCDRALPLAGIYFLAPRQPNLAVPSITRCDPLNGVLLLANNLYATSALDPASRPREVKVLESVVTEIPVNHVSRPDSLDRLPAVLDLLEADSRFTAYTDR